MSQFNNNTPTLVISTMFENLQYSVFANGYSRETLAETETLATDRAYSPLDLFPEVTAAQGEKLTRMEETANYRAQLARVGTMYEGSKILPNGKGKDSYLSALILDLFQTTSKATVKAAAERLRLLAVWKAAENDPLLRYTLIHNDETITDICCKANQLKDRILPNLKRNFGGVWSVTCQGVQKNTPYQEDAIRYASQLLAKTAKGRKPFTLPDDGQESDPIDSLHFYKWMTDQEVTNHNTLSTRWDYLKTQGFNMGLHHLTEAQNTMFRVALDQHFRDTMLDSNGALKVGK